MIHLTYKGCYEDKKIMQHLEEDISNLSFLALTTLLSEKNCRAIYCFNKTRDENVCLYLHLHPQGAHSLAQVVAQAPG